MVFVNIINSIVNFMKTEVISFEGFNFTLWEIVLVDVLLIVGGSAVGYFITNRSDV